jgi:ElaB/YqjD/DUF883 family membrane-anchored ribosome-binding protein
MTPPTLETPSATTGGHDRIHRLVGTMHRAIDNLQQRLQPRPGEPFATSRYGEQARQYGERLREQIGTRPLQAAGIAVGTGVVLDRLLTSRSPSVRVVKVPAQAPSRWQSVRSPGRRATDWTDAAAGRLHEVRAEGHRAVGKLGAVAGAGIAGTRALASGIARTAGTVPLQLQLATHRLLERSHRYGSLARSGVQAHPLIGVGAGLGLGALVTTLLMLRRQPAYGTAYVAVDARGHPVPHREPEPGRSRATQAVAARPVTSAVVAIGLGALVGALLMRR